MGVGNNKNRYRLAVLSVMLLIGLSCSIAAAAPTNITACGIFGAGSYLVANNISSAGITCLTFNAGPVTLDLNGFTVSGSGFTNGVLATSVPNVTVRNGTITGFARSIYATGAGAVIDGVRALTGTSANGITVGPNSTIENCLVSGHTAGGIVASNSATVVNNTLTGNTGNTIIVGDSSLVKGNRLSFNTGGSTDAIRIPANSKVVDNVILGNSFGIHGTGLKNLISGNTITNCVEGIIVGNDTTITGNNVSENTDNGIEAGVQCLISGNNASDNTNVGITSGINTLFLNNVASNNGNFGIHVNSGGSAIGNLTDFNGASGLEVGCPSKVDNNTALSNVAPNLDTSGAGCLLTNNLAP